MGLGHAPNDVTTFPKLINPGMPTHAPPGVDAADGRIFFGKPREQVPARNARAGGGAVQSRVSQRRAVRLEFRSDVVCACDVAQFSCRQQQIVHRIGAMSPRQTCRRL